MFFYCCRYPWYFWNSVCIIDIFFDDNGNSGNGINKIVIVGVCVFILMLFLFATLFTIIFLSIFHKHASPTKFLQRH